MSGRRRREWRGGGEALGVQPGIEHRPADRDHRIPGAQLGDAGPAGAQTGEEPVKLRLVGDLDADRRGAVVVAGQVESAEPDRPWSSRCVRSGSRTSWWPRVGTT